MPRGNMDHTTVDQFDISAFLNLMSQCSYFAKFVKSKTLITQVTNVRNQVMHSADFRVEKGELESYLGRIKDLGQALKTHYPKFSELTEEIEQLQNTDFSFIMSCVGKKIALAADNKVPESMLKLQNFLSLEQQILKEKLECLSQRYEEDRETALTLEELQCVRVFLEGNNDLQESLAPQWERLTEVQEKVDTLTVRVDTLERNTRTHDPEFSTDILKYKNHLYEEARRQGWPEPVFSEIKEALGYRGRVRVRGQTFEGVQVCPKSKTAHQEVAKLALSQLAKDSASLSELANDTEEGEASSSQTDQPQSLSCTDGPGFVMCVAVRVQKDLDPHEASSREEALQAAYCSLLQGLSLGPPPTAGGEKQSVLEFFRRAKCVPPVEDCVTTMEGKHRCTLRIVGELTFHSTEAAPKKQQAEHCAAKEALRRLNGVLSGVLGGDIGRAGPNYKGKLQELLAKHGGGAKPEYKNTEANKIRTGAAASQMSGETAAVGTTLQGDKLSITTETTPDDSGPPPSKRSAGGEMEEIRRCLALWSLQPPCVVCEDVSVEQLCKWMVEVRLDRHAFRNQTLFSSKKEAICWSCHSLGTAGDIFQPGTDESKSTEVVKKFFLQRSFPWPVEEVAEPEKGRFCCNLKDITCVFTYRGEGSSEAAACQSAYQRALSRLAPFIGYCAPVAPPSSTEDAKQKLSTLLEGTALTSVNSALSETQYRISAQLRFLGYSMETEGQDSKKATRAQLSQRLLGLLGEDEMDSTASARNVLDEWFVKKGLEKPVFEYTNDKFGTKVTFSAPLICSYKEWQASREKAKKKLIDELQRRVKYFCEGSTN
nr:uncharacterized protein LOC124041575 isoform X2 [Oncorhynchus gorbuscha]